MRSLSLLRARSLILRVLFIVTLLVAPLQPNQMQVQAQIPKSAPTSLKAPTTTSSTASQPAEDNQIRVLTNLTNPALDAPPKESEAVVVDPNNPNWVTRYGTEAGRLFLPPRQSDQPAAPDGAIPPFNGFWITRTIQSGTQGIRASAYSADGRFFAALNGLGLRVFGPNGSGIYQWTSITASPGGLLSNNVTALAIFNNKLWIGTNGAGVNTYDLKSGAWFSYTVASSPLPNNIINRFTPVIDPNGPDYIWISTNSGAAKLTPGRPNTWNIINTVDGLPSNTVYDVAVDINGLTVTTWFATFGGLTSWNGSTFTNQYGQCSGNNWNYATRVIVDRLHHVWFTPIVIVPGLSPNQPSTVSYDPIGVCVRTVGAIPFPIVFWTLYNTTSPGLPGNYVTDLSEDFAGRIWMSIGQNLSGTGGGAAYDNGTWCLPTTTKCQLQRGNYQTVLAAGEAVWWGYYALNTFVTFSPNWLRYTSTQIGGLPSDLYLEANRTWAGANTEVAHTDNGAWFTQTLPGNNVTVSSFARDGNNHLWVGTFGNGVYELSAGNTFMAHYTTTHGLPGNIVTSVYADDLGRAWVGTTNGLALRAEAGYWLTFTTNSSPLVSNFIAALEQDSNERLWIGTDKGISIYDLNAVGTSAWSTQTLATGVPSTTINGLVRDPIGTMWAATDAGVGAWNPISQTWKVYSTTNGALPNNIATAITADPSGRIWVTTHGGVALYEGNVWRQFHVPGTAIESNRPFDVVADNDRTWIGASNSIAVRGVITSPIGSSVPIISSFAPTSAIPGATIVITGNYFDERGPEFNLVKFPNQNHFPTIPTDIVTVTKTKLTVKVPALSSSGQLQVEANGLKSTLSAVTFNLKPTITGLSATCVAAGVELKINGGGFMDGSAAAYVKIGNGPERIADATDPTEIRTFIRAGDLDGKVRVRLLNGQSTLSDQSVTVAGLSLLQSATQQAVEGEQMIWGKRTLIMLQLKSTGCAGGTIDEAKAEWKMSTGTVGYGGNGNFLDIPGGRTFGTTAATFNVANSLSIMADLDLAFLADDIGLPDSPYMSSLQFFKGMTVTLTNNNFPVMAVVLPKSSFNFIDTTAARRHFTMMDVVGQDAAHQSSDFHTTMMDNLEHVARIFPQQDSSWYSLQYSWLHETPIWIDTPPINFKSGEGNYDLAIDPVDDYLEPDGNYWAVALVDQKNIDTSDGNYTGIGGIPARTVADTNADGSGGKGILHELMHGFGFVDDDSPNYKSSNKPGEDNHSKYDEGQWSDDGSTFDDCQTSATFKQALTDQTGADRRVALLFGTDAPKQLRTAACNSAAEGDQSGTAKSLISYAPARSNVNSFLEPLDYGSIIDQICRPLWYAPTYNFCPGYMGLSTSTPIGLAQLKTNAPNVVTRTLRINGKIDLNDVVTTSLSYLAFNEGEVTPQAATGDYHLIVRNAGNAILHDQVFELNFEVSPPHPSGDQNNSPLLHPQEAITATFDRFNLRVPFPIGAVEAEIQHNGSVIYSDTVSANTPTVNFVTPNGGTYNAANVISVTWTANDLNSDPLQFGLDYSPDNGANWTLIAPKLLGNSFAWMPNFVPASTTARLRLRASDGFNVGVATSNPFTLTARAPEAIIMSPDNDAILTEGSILKLEGMSLTDDGPNLGSFLWRRGGATIGTTHTITTALNSIGLITYTLRVNKDSLIGTSVVTINVVPDYDRDQMPNDWETQHQLNPLDAGDALNNPDGDGLTNLDEYHAGTKPHVYDTDGDGYSDGAEIAAGTDPLKAASHPITTPILNVGSNFMGFTVNDLVPFPDHKSTWVTNGGGGTLNWSLNKDANWLNVSPLSGGAPQELTINVIPFSVVTGTHIGHITVTAPSTIGSPQVITVTLHVDAIVPTYLLYLPVVLK